MSFRPSWYSRPSRISAAAITSIAFCSAAIPAFSVAVMYSTSCGGLDAAPVLVDVGARPDIDVVLTQMVGEHRRKVRIDVDRAQAVLAADRGDEVRPSVELVATGGSRREVEPRGAAHLTRSRLLARATLLERARPEDGVVPAVVDDDHRVGAEESGAVQDVGVVIRLTEQQDGTLVTHATEPSSRVSRYCGV